MLFLKLDNTKRQRIFCENIFFKQETLAKDNRSDNFIHSCYCLLVCCLKKVFSLKVACLVLYYVIKINVKKKKKCFECVH